MIKQNISIIIFIFLFSQRMINAISCYYCSTIIHGNRCNDPFLSNTSTYSATFNSSYTACAKIMLSNLYGGVVLRGPRMICNSIDDATGSLWCCYSNYCNNSQRITFKSKRLVFLILLIFILLKPG